MGTFLNKKERFELLKAHRCESRQRFADRIKAVLLLDAEWPVSTIAEALLIDRDTVRRYRVIYESEGIDGLCSFKYEGRQCALSDDELKELESELRSKIYLCTAKVVTYIQKTFGVNYRSSGVVALLHRLGFSYKKPCLVPGKADAKSQREFLSMLSKLKRSKSAEDKL
jgi:transposase